MKYAFVDTWGWCALVNEAETAHLETSRLFQELMDRGVIFLTTNFVLDGSIP